MPEFEINTLGFREKLWLYKAYVWKSFLLQDFLMCYKYAHKWMQLFKGNPKVISLHPVFYLKGKNYLLESLFFLKHYSKFKEELNFFKEEIKNQQIPLNSNTELLIFQYYTANQLHLHFLEGTFKEGEYLVREIEQKIKKYKSRLDDHHIVVLYYKIACLYFGMGENRKCIMFLTKIIDSKNLQAAEDLQCFARVLNLIAHYECGMDYHLERQFKDTYKFLLKMQNLQAVQKEFIVSIKALSDVYPHQIKSEFKKIHARLQKFENHPYEKRAFLYLDILSWLESKIENKTIGEVIRKKATTLSR